EVPRGLPDPGGHDDGRVLADHVLAHLHERPPPGLLDVVLELDPERTVVVARADPPVDLARLEGEAAALGQVDDRVHRVAWHWGGLPVSHRGWLPRRPWVDDGPMLPEAIQTISPSARPAGPTPRSGARPSWSPRRRRSSRGPGPWRRTASRGP